LHVFTTIAEIEAVIGTELGVTGWLEIDQERINGFADVTGDHQWIHVDVERAASSPFHGTIAHGYLTLSLVPYFGNQLMSLQTSGTRLNYGVNKVRFPTPVPVGSRVRGRATVVGIPRIPTGHQLTVAYTIELEGAEKPACVAETVVLLLDD
jgi:acyl dehydratase